MRKTAIMMAVMMLFGAASCYAEQGYGQPPSEGGPRQWHRGEGREMAGGEQPQHHEQFHHHKSEMLHRLKERKEMVERMMACVENAASHEALKACREMMHK